MVASFLRGKHKTNFTPHSDAGDYVIVVNAEKIKLTGKKLTDKVYIHYTGYPGGQRFANPKELLNRKPITVVEKAVKGMLPKTKLGREVYRNLFVYAGGEHPHQAQNPKKVETKNK
jgi:large subunit ribosomal protein L13